MTSGRKPDIRTAMGHRIWDELNRPGGLRSLSMLASKAGVTKSMISKWCREDVERKSSLKIQKLAEQLGVTARWLEHGLEPKYDDSRAPYESPLVAGRRFFLSKRAHRGLVDEAERFLLAIEERTNFPDGDQMSPDDWLEFYLREFRIWSDGPSASDVPVATEETTPLTIRPAPAKPATQHPIATPDPSKRKPSLRPKK